MTGFAQLLLRWAVLALGVALATKIVPGIECDDGLSLLAVVLLLSFFNAILKPLLVLFTLPFILLTLGLGIIVINALLFMFVGKLVDGFYVAGFWSAVGGALIVSITNMVLSGLTKPRVQDERGNAGRTPPQQRPAVREKKDDVIDI
jgi:putative membrane protein